MVPLLFSNSYVLTVNKSLKLNKLFVISHKKYGKIVKKLIKIDRKENLWFKGENNSSIPTEKIGPIKSNQILGQVVLSVSKNSLKVHC